MNQYEKLIKSRHPRYDEKTLTRLRDAFWASSNYTSNLTTHRLENAKDFQDRKNAAVPKTIVQSIVEAYTDYLFAANWEVTPDTPTLKLLREDATRNGIGLDLFIKQTAQWASLYGYVLIGADTPRVDTAALGKDQVSERDRQELGLRPYLYMIDPIDVLNWRTNDEGELTEVLVREYAIPTSMLEAADGERSDPTVVRYRYWNSQQCLLIDADGNLAMNPLDTANPFGVVPFAVMKGIVYDDPVYAPGLENVEKAQRRVLEIESQLDEIFKRQTFSQLIVQGIAEDYAVEGDPAVIGTKTIFAYPEGHNAPQFISPDAAQANLLMAERDDAITTAFAQAGLADPKMQADANPAVKSGAALRMEFVRTNQKLQNIAQAIAPAYRRVIWLCGQMNRNNTPESAIKVKPPNEFAITSIDSEINRLKELSASHAATSLLDEQMRIVAAAMRPNDDKKLLNELENELKEEAAHRAEMPELGTIPADDAGEDEDE